MMRSMFTGVAGLRTHQMKMDVIGNNIANVNTVGFKAGSVTFKEMFYQSMQGASAPNADTGRGGTNPLQVGLGVSVGSIDNVMSQGAAQTTDNPLDMMINGNAFFIVDGGNGYNFTRAGAFRLDVDGTLVNPAGLKVMGWPVVTDPDNADKTMVKKGRVEPINIKSQENMSINPVASQNAVFEGNLKIEDGKTDDGVLKSIDFFDSLGNKYTMDYTFYYDEKMTGTHTLPDGTTETVVGGWVAIPVEEPVDPNANPVVMQVAMTKNGDEENKIFIDPTLITAPAVAPGQIAFQMNKDGSFKASGTLNNDFDPTDRTIPLTFTPNPVSQTEPDASSIFKLPAFGPDILGVNAETNEIKVNLTGVTQHESTTSIKGYSVDGSTSGTMIGFSIGPGGIITGSYSNGKEKILGQIAVANFKNPAGLEKIGDNLFVTTPNSGSFDGIGDDPTLGGGSIGGSRLEMSNVDLSREFTEMITTQRGFQANSKVITTSDEMLQELVRLK